MTEKEFRNNAELREELAAALNLAALGHALQIVETRYYGADAILDASPTASVRLLSQSAGRKQFTEELRRLAEPWPEAPSQIPETFGTNYSVEDFDESEE